MVEIAFGCSLVERLGVLASGITVYGLQGESGVEGVKQAREGLIR